MKGLDRGKMLFRRRRRSRIRRSVAAHARVFKIEVENKSQLIEHPPLMRGHHAPEISGEPCA